MTDKTRFEGGCTCRAVRYRMHRAPLIVNCCHCRWCQRETGAAFALNGLLEATELTVLKGQVEMIDTPTNSGSGQRIARCPDCHVALWSNYSSAKDAIHFVRVGTLDDPSGCEVRTFYLIAAFIKCGGEGPAGLSLDH